MALYNAQRIASTPKRPLDSFTIVNCFHISCAVVVPLMCIISASLIANSIWVQAFASPVFYSFCNLISASVGGVFATGGAEFSSMYSSIPRSLRVACIWHFHGIHLLDPRSLITINNIMYNNIQKHTIPVHAGICRSLSQQ